MPTITNPTAPATEAQVNYYVSLSVQFATRTDKGADEAAIRELAKAWAQNSSKAAVSKAIDNLSKQTAALPKAKAPTVEPGYYSVNGETFTVVLSKTSGKPYAKKWVVLPGAKKATWQYAPGGVYALEGIAPMTLDEAKAFGHSHGYCIRCGALLTDPNSVEAGIGPVCAGYWS